MGDWEARLAGYTEDQQHQQQQQQQQQQNVADGSVAHPPPAHPQQSHQPSQPAEQQQSWDGLGDVMHVDWGAWGWHEQQQQQQPSQPQATEHPVPTSGGGGITSPASAARYLQEAFFAHSSSSTSTSQTQGQAQGGMEVGVGAHQRPLPHRGHTLPSLPLDQSAAANIGAGVGAGEPDDRFAWFDQHLPHALNHPTHSRLSVSSALALEAHALAAPPPSSSSTPAQTPTLPRPISPLSAFLQDHFGQPPPQQQQQHRHQQPSGSTFTPPSRPFVPPGVPVPSQQPKRGRADAHPRSQPHSRPSSRSANRAGAGGSGGPSPSSTSSSPVGARGPATPYTPINHPTASSSSTSNATPASATGFAGRGAAARGSGADGEGTGGGSTDQPSPTGTVTVEEDRRLRNTAASAKFRQKRKHYVERLHREVDELTGRREVLYHEVEELKKENGFLKKMVQLKLGFQLPSSTPDPSPSSSAPSAPAAGGSGSGSGTYDPGASSSDSALDFDFDQVGLGQMPPQIPHLPLQLSNYLDGHSHSHSQSHTDDFLIPLPPPATSQHSQPPADGTRDKGKGKRRKSAGG